ncbi:MAG: hypothetical protein WA603_16090 [Candidatus Acidiferrales bacterium]
MQGIEDYNAKVLAFPGLAGVGHAETLAAQFVDSLRRIEFAHHIRDAKHSSARGDPASGLFDPLRAAVLCNRRGEANEAWWLVFLATHFGKHAVDGWRLARDVYGKLGQKGRWDWETISPNPPAFHAWLAANEETLRGADGTSRRFSNHRKYESLRVGSPKGTAATFSSYVAWVAPPRSHPEIVRELHQQVGQNPGAVFEALYRSMGSVHRFGRLGKFDFLTMLGKLGIAPIEPGVTYLKGSTGPLAGARLLVGGARDADLAEHELESKLVDFGAKIGVAAQPMEDALCNWQKSPGRYELFRG